MNKPMPGPLHLRMPDSFHPHSIEIRVESPEGECWNWIIRASEPKTGARRGESPTWLGWRGESNFAALIVAAVNACFAINPSNPLAVAEGMGGIVDALRGLMWRFDEDDDDQEAPEETAPSPERGSEGTNDILAARAALEKLVTPLKARLTERAALAKVDAK